MDAKDLIVLADAALNWAAKTCPTCKLPVFHAVDLPDDRLRVNVTALPNVILLNMEFDTVQEALAYLAPLTQQPLF